MLGGLQLALNKTHLKTIIRRNGHLRLEGDETKEELQIALIYLRGHTWVKCRNPYGHTPIESLIPDISVLGGLSTGKGNAKRKTVDITSERL
jgi:hypothetical protein